MTPSNAPQRTASSAYDIELPPSAYHPHADLHLGPL